MKTIIQLCSQLRVGKTISMTAGTVQEVDDERESCGVDLLQLLPGLYGGISFVDPLQDHVIAGFRHLIWRSVDSP